MCSEENDGSSRSGAQGRNNRILLVSNLILSDSLLVSLFSQRVGEGGQAKKRSSNTDLNVSA